MSTMYYTQIERRDMKATIKAIDQEIAALDIWFISHISSKDWSDKINHYWAITARRNDIFEKMNTTRRLRPSSGILPAECPTNNNHN